MSLQGVQSEPVITARRLGKQYTIYRQPANLRGAVRSLFRRETTVVHAVTDLDLTVEPGEVVGLLGPNGAGKTTIVKMLCGLLEPSSGHLTVCGQRPADRSYRVLSQISVMFGQKAMLWWDVSTRESLRVHRSMYEIPRAEFAATVAELGELLDIADILDTPVRNLSLGQRMRCELALALAHRPALLFADEPTIGLDVEAKGVVRRLFREVNQTLGTTILLTSHDMDDVEELTQRVVIVSAGHATFDGPLRELRERANLPRELVLTYRTAPCLPTADRLALVEVGERHVRLRVGDRPLGQLVAEATRWGELLDVQVVEPRLDAVMSAMFHAPGSRS